MTIEQTVEIPADHRVFLELPFELPIGKAKVTVTSVVEKPAAYGEIENLRGIARRMGSTLTVAQFLEMRREDMYLEEEKFRTFFKKNG